MGDHIGRVIPVAIEDEVKESYLTYAMSVIVSRALPDARDGLKPVHRRILYSMSEMGLRNNTPYKKCGRIVGDVLGKYHPHGDQSIYDALVRLAQDFSLRMPVVQGQGNFGSVDGDPPAAMRYTEARLAKVSEAILRDIKKETVDFVPNYDDSMMQPSVLPTAFPFLLVNGSSGIAVGMATNMAPHNLSECCDAINATIDNPEIDSLELTKYVKGPDFPTGGIIFGRKGIIDAATTGRGKITVRSKTELEEMRGDREAIIVSEIPYMVNKANLVIKIAELVRDKKIDGISDLRDESDRNGMRVVIVIKKGFSPKVVLNQLYAHTSLQQNFNVNNLAIHNGLPKMCNLKDLIKIFIEHRQDVITRRTIFDRNKAQDRAHILEGLQIALENVDEVVAIIKKSTSVVNARVALMARFELSEKQAQAILDMRLQKITSLETQKIIDELKEIHELIAYLQGLLDNPGRILSVIQEETTEIKEKYGNDRLSEINPQEVTGITIEDLIEQEDMVVLISNKGFIKRVSLSEYKEQGRGGKGSNSAKLKDGDFVEHIFIANTHDIIMFVTSVGKAYWLKVHEIPEASRQARGSHLKTIFEFEEDEEITTTVSLNDFNEETFLFMATNHATVKRVTTFNFRNAKTRGIKAIKLDEGEKLISAKLTDGNQDIVLISQKGKGLRFPETAVRVMGRDTHGVRGIKLAADDKLVGVCVGSENEQMLLLSEQGFGKRTLMGNLSYHNRATQGQIIYKVNEKTGKVIGSMTVTEEDHIVCITQLGKTLKVRTSLVSLLGKNAFGVKILNIDKNDDLVGLAKAINTDPEPEQKDLFEESDEAESSVITETTGIEAENTEIEESTEVEESTEE